MSSDSSHEYRFFISSTMKDLESVRDKVDQAIRDLGHQTIRAEKYGTSSATPRSVVLEMVETSDVLIGIYGSRYGSIPKGESISVTELEFNKAKELGKEILIYVLETPSREPEMQTFLQRIEDFDSGLFRRPYIRTVDELTVCVQEDILDLTRGNKFHLFTFKEYARRLIEWTYTYKESAWGGRYTELVAKPYGMLIYTRRVRADDTSLEFISKVLQNNEVSIILGEAGAGKTTALLRAIENEAKRVLVNATNKVPIYIALNSWTMDQDIEELIRVNLASLGKELRREVLAAYLAEGRFMLGLDGINEIPAEHRAKGAQKNLSSFIKLNSRNHISVTSRFTGFDSSSFYSWPVFEIQPLDRTSIQDFLIKYLGPNKGTDLFIRLGGNANDQWERPHSLINLARNPLLLWMLTETFDNFGIVPPNKGDLIKSFVDFILQTREQGKASKYKPSVKENLLRVLAFEMTEKGETVKSSTETVLRVFSTVLQKLRQDGRVDANTTVQDLLDEISANGLLRIESADSIRWAHQIFQEYSAALELVHGFEANLPIWKQLSNIEWKESVIMAAGLTEKPELYLNEVLYGWRGFVGLILGQNPRGILALDCIVYTHLWDNELLKNKIFTIVRQRISSSPNQRLINLSGTIIKVLGPTLSRFTIPFTKAIPNNIYSLSLLLWFWGEAREQRALLVLTKSLKNENRHIRWLAANALGKIRDVSTTQDLVAALYDSDDSVRWVTIQALINLGTSEPSSALARLLYDIDPTIRWAAAFALGQIGVPENIPELKRLEETDQFPLWWGEKVADAASAAIREIELRTSSKPVRPERKMPTDMVEYVYHRTP